MIKKQTLILTLATLMTMSLHAQTLAVNGTVNDTLQLNEIVINASRADNKSPLTTSEMSRSKLEAIRMLPSLPYQIELEPSVVVSGENGMVGATSFRIRGVDATRINVNINGITLNDPESQAVFWYNIPNLGGMAQNIQIQRGLGASNGGTASMGGALNLQTFSVAPKPYAQADLAYGSFNTAQYGLTFGTGRTPHGFAFDMALNGLNSDGFVRNGMSNQKSVFLNGGWYGKRSLVKAVFIMGHQRTGITWDGAYAEDLDQDPTYNGVGAYYDEFGNVHYYDNETDNYTQHHFQLHFVHQFSPKLSLASTLHFTKGDGYYENYKYNVKFSKYGLDPQTIKGITYKKTDVIIRQSMDNSYAAGALNLKYKADALDLAAGINYSFYDGDHFGNILWSKYNQNLDLSKPWYTNNGKKADASVFAKAEFAIAGNLTGFIDLQYRFINFKLSGMDKDFVGLDNKKEYNFFNPKIGMNYRTGKDSKLFYSISIAHREPSRSDIKESIKAGKQDLLKSERMLDYELGYQFRRRNSGFQINLYSMNYKNQLVSTGRLTETGYVIQENIPDSYRRGVEVSGLYSPIDQLLFFATATYSKNKLKNYTLFVDAYDKAEDWNPTPQHQVFLKKSNLTLSPELIASGGFTVTPEKNANITLMGKYVGKQYMDNSSVEVAKVPAYFTMSLDAAKTLVFKNDSKLRISICVDNLLNRKYYSYGWIYRAVFDDGSADYLEKGVYAQATIHFIGKIQFTF